MSNETTTETHISTGTHITLIIGNQPIVTYTGIAPMIQIAVTQSTNGGMNTNHNSLKKIKKTQRHDSGQNKREVEMNRLNIKE